MNTQFTSLIAASTFAVLASSAGAATLITSAFSNFNDVVDDQGTWQAQRAALNTTGWTGSFATNTPTTSLLDSVSFIRNAGTGTTAGNILLVVTTHTAAAGVTGTALSAAIVGGIAATSSASVNAAAVGAGATLTFQFDETTASISTSTLYSWMFVLDVDNNGIANATDTIAHVRLANVGTGATDILTGGTSIAAYNNGINGGSGRDLYMEIVTVPEPSAALLGGLGMLALLRRRRA